MLQQKTNTHKIILLSVGVLVLMMGILIVISPTAIFPDPSWGFQVLQKMQAGGGFNIITKPDPRDISKDYSEFLSWWSPGQYLVPYFFKAAFHLNPGQASAITTTLFSILGLAGLYAFFKKAGFTPFVSALSVAVVASQRAFFVPYVFYNGGEVLLFGFIGWFLYGCLSINKTGWQLVLFLLLSGWIGFFCKSSFLWAYGAGCLYLWISLSTGQKNILEWIKRGIWIAIPTVISLFFIYKFYLSKGANPASGALGIKLAWETFTFPLASPLLAGFSIDDIFNGLIYHNNASILNPFWSLVTLLVCTLVSIVLVTNVVRKVPEKKYTLLLIVFYAVSVLFFGYNFLKQADISYESRHFRIIGLLVTPGVIYLATRWRQFFKIVFSAACIVIALSGFKYFIPSYHQNSSKNAHGLSGFAQLFADQQSLDYILALDKNNTHALFVFTSPDLGLEISHNRYITIDPVDAGPPADIDDLKHWGHAGPIYIMLPANYSFMQSNAALQYFPGYSSFKKQVLSKKYVLYSAQ